MEAFARTSTILFAKANTNKPLSSAKALLSRSSSHVHHHTSFLRHRAIQLVVLPQTRVLMNPDSAGAGIHPTTASKTVHVQFQLHKECGFGENFLLVGNEPIMGEWNPASAIPLNWSDGNIWSVELDIPIDRAVQFKFILKKSTGDLLWQPGPDRILHTWDTNNTITIAEDWKNMKLQRLTEQKMFSQDPAPLANHVIGSVVSGNILNQNQAASFSETFAYRNGIPTYSSNNELFLGVKGVHSGEGTLLQESQEGCIAQDGICVLTRPPALSSIEDDEYCEVEYYDDEYYEDYCEYEARYEDEDTIFTYEGGDVLVPGLVQGVTEKTIDITGPTDNSTVIDVRETIDITSTSMVVDASNEQSS